MKLPSRRQVLSLLMVMLVMSFGASPAHAGGEQTCKDSMIAKATTFVTSGGFLGNAIFEDSTDCWAYGDFTETSDKTKLKAFEQGLTINDSQSTFGTVATNRLEDSKSIAWGEAKYTLVTELNDGSTKSIAKTRANRSVEDYYSKLQYNAIQQWNNYIFQLQSINQTGVRIQLKTTDGTNGWNTYSGNDWTTENASFTLANGTSVTIKEYGPPASMSYALSPLNDHQASGDYSYAAVNDTTQDGTQYHVMFVNTDVHNILYESDTKADQIKNGMNDYGNEVYTQYSTGDLNTTELVSPITLARNAGTDYNSTGSNQFAAIQLATLGHSGNLNTSFTVNVTVDGSTSQYDGTLFYTGDDIDSLETGVTYDVGTDQPYNGTFIMAVQRDDGSATTMEWGADQNASVEIAEMRDVDTGATVENTTVKQYNYKTANASALESELDRLAELLDQYESADTSSGSSSGGLNMDPLTVAGIVLAAGVVYLLGKDDDEPHHGGRY